MNDHLYPLSRDYEKLWELSRRGSVVCYANYDWGFGPVYREIPRTKVFDDVAKISARGGQSRLRNLKRKPPSV